MSANLRPTTTREVFIGRSVTLGGIVSFFCYLRGIPLHFTVTLVSIMTAGQYTVYTGILHQLAQSVFEFLGVLPSRQMLDGLAMILLLSFMSFMVALCIVVSLTIMLVRGV